MALKFKIDKMDSNQLYEFFTKEKIDPNKQLIDGRNNTTLFAYLLKMQHPVKLIKLLIQMGGNLENTSINLANVNPKYLPMLLPIQLNDIDRQKLIIELLIKNDIDRIVSFYKDGFLTRDQIFDVLKNDTRLIILSLERMYQEIGSISKKYYDTEDVLLFNKIVTLEKNSINLFKLIKMNGIDLREISDVQTISQMIFNSYLYHLIGYFVDLIDQSTLTNVHFYHYSNFPVSNKIIMSSIYNDENFVRIEQLLRDKYFIKKIIKKQVGPKTLNIDSYNNNVCPIELINLT